MIILFQIKVTANNTHEERVWLSDLPLSERQKVLEELKKAEAVLMEDLKKLGLPKNYKPID